VLTVLAPDDQPDACSGSVAERHRQSGLGFHLKAGGVHLKCARGRLGSLSTPPG
jgi:hypothetical protein